MCVGGGVLKEDVVREEDGAKRNGMLKAKSVSGAEEAPGGQEKSELTCGCCLSLSALLPNGVWLLCLILPNFCVYH